MLNVTGDWRLYDSLEICVLTAAIVVLGEQFSRVKRLYLLSLTYCLWASCKFARWEQGATGHIKVER
jgi:hypothetical protein